MGMSGLTKETHDKWLEGHIVARGAESERRRRLAEGLGHAECEFIEKIWWPIVGSLDDLHPEYEVSDSKDGSRFLDFAYIRSNHRVCIEIDGYGAHQRNASRRVFGDDRFRQNDLVLDDWVVLRFAYDDLQDRPRQCQQYIGQMLGKLFGLGVQRLDEQNLSLNEREIIRWALRRGAESSFTPKEIIRLLGVSHPTIRRYVRNLVQQKLLEHASGVKRVRSYRVSSKAVKLHI